MPTEASTTNDLQNNTDSIGTYLIKGDISGIQGFIFNVKSDGAARSLKGRSFFLKILLEVGMRLVFDSYDVPDAEREAAKVSTSGGNFILKLELPDDHKINEIQKVLTKSLQLTGLNMMLCAVAATDDFKESKERLSRAIRERKYQLWQDDFSTFTDFEKEKILAFYNERGGEKKKNNWSDLTNALKENKHVSIQKKWNDALIHEFDIKNHIIRFAGYEVRFNRKGEGIDLENHLEKLFPLDHKKDIISFENLTKNGYGIRKLAVLAMDVDNLGALVEEIEDLEEHRELDKKLSHFFNIQIRDLINKSYKNEVYTVTAGGDDSYFVGKWNTMIDLAIDLKRAFHKEFAKERSEVLEKKNKDLTISAAVTIVHPKFPVIRFAQMVDDALKSAKQDHPDSRGNVSIFGEVIKWRFLENEISEIRRELQPVNYNGRRNQEKVQAISGGLLAKARFKTLDVIEGDGLRLSHYWELSYFMRNYGKDGQKTLAKYRNHLNQASNAPDEFTARNYKLIFPIAARLAELDNRK